MHRLLALVVLVTLCNLSEGFVCEGDGFYADPHDCAKFFRCVSGTKFSFTCGPGTHFNPGHNGCDWPYNVNCKASDGEQPTRYQQPSGQEYSQRTGQEYNQQTGQGYNQQTGQEYNQQTGQWVGQYDQQPNSQYGGQHSGQSYGQQPSYNYGQYGQQSGGQTHDQLSGQDYGQQPIARSEQTYSSSNYGSQQTPYGSHGQQSAQRPHQTSHRLPDESQQVDSRQSPDTDSQSRVPYREYNRRAQKTYVKTDRRGEELTDEEDSYEQPIRAKPRPKSRPPQKPSNELAEDNDFDHKFDEPIEERRPKARPKPRPRVPQPVDSEEDEEVTTSRPKVPKRKYRIRTTTPVSTTEAEDTSDEEDNEFSQFENEVKTKKDNDLTDEDNKWLLFEEKTTTTEDPFVSMLKTKVPTIGNRNRSRSDWSRRNGRRYETTPRPDHQSGAEATTTVDPFDKEWSDFMSGTNRPNSGQAFDDNSRDSKRTKKPLKSTDPMLMSDVISYFNCTEAGKGCDVCEDLDWIKYSGIGVQSTPYRSYKFHLEIASKQCYKACSDSQQCIAFAYSLSTGMCHVYDELTTGDLVADEDFNVVVKNPKNTVMNSEWIHTKNGLISGSELYSMKTDTALDCLQECINDMDNCLAVDFDSVETNCRVFDANEGFTVDKLKANSVVLQHLGLFDDNNRWRFDDMGSKTVSNGRPFETIKVKEPEECFYECVESVGNNCSLVTIEDEKKSTADEDMDNEEDNGNKLCHLFAFTSSPKWITSEDKSNNSYVLNVAKNNSVFKEYSGYTYVGNPVAIKEGLTEDQCRRYAEEKCRFCRKYTSVVETKECAVFSDSALLSPAIKDTNYTERSGLITIPKDPEYMAFVRIPWKMFATDVSPYELKGEINGQKCLQFCLKQKACLATALVYDTVDSTMFCYFFKGADIKNANVVEYENVDLFVKIMAESELPGHMANKTDECSDGRPLDDAVRNMADLKDNLDYMSLRKSSSHSDRYASNSYPLSPHGYDYSGGPKDDNTDEISGSSAREQSKRVVRNANDLRSDVRQQKKNSVIESPNGLDFIENVRQNARKESILDQIPSISSELRRTVKRLKIEAKNIDKDQQKRPETDRKLVDRLFEVCENDSEFDFESNRCKTKVKDVSKMCSKLPQIVYMNTKHMQSCNETQVGGDCPVVCRPGYEPTIDKIRCERAGNRNVWRNGRQVKCKPIESDCQAIGSRDETTVRVKHRTQYPEQKVHFITSYDTDRKSPLFSAYVHTKENNMNATNGTTDDDIDGYYENSCDLLTEKQPKISDYKESNYNPKPLLATNAFLYSNEAQSMLKALTNIAPQDPFTSRGPWRTVENRTLEMLKSRPGIVISGVCEENIPKHEIKYKTSGSGRQKRMEIPKCFWSVVCVPADDEGVTAAAFYADNTHPISQLEKQSRVHQIRQYRDQRFIVKLLGTEMYRKVWSEVFNGFKDLNKGINSFIHKCAETQKNSPKAMAFWDNVLNGDQNVDEWQSKFEYGLEDSDLQLKNETAVRERQQRLSARRRERDDQTISGETENNELFAGNKCENKVIAYLTPFGDKKFTERQGIALTHAIFAYLDMNSMGYLGPFDGHSSDNRLKFAKLYEMLAVKSRLSARGHKLNIMVSIGGWNNSEHFSTIVSSRVMRNNFMADMLSAVKYWGLDGVDIDWKYPVIGSAKPGNQSDREQFVSFLSEIRHELDVFGKRNGLKERLLLSITAASGHWIIEESYDLKNIVPIVDWINVLTYDYFGPWKSKWGAYTGPNAPLYPSAPITSLTKMNIHSTLEQYFCSLKSSAKLVLSIPFYGHYWNNVGEPIDSKDPLFRDAHPVGGFVTYGNIKHKWLTNSEFQHLMHNKSFTPYLWSEYRRVFLTYENRESVAEKTRYAVDHRLGGVSIWALDFDDDDNDLLNSIVDNNKNCHKSERKQWTDSLFKCGSYIKKKWWSDSDGLNEGLCGRSAPLINGYYPICDPDSDSQHCCSSWGRCGSGPQFCQCKGCVDYKADPEAMDREPTRATQPIRWLTSDMLANGEESEGIPVCGYRALELNGSHPICNPDDDNSHCCSAEGLCGSGAEYCECKQCVDFRKNSTFVYVKKLWWDELDGANRAGRCGKLAPKIDNSYPICNPNSEAGYCCGKWGTCGSGPLSCQCIGCVDFKKRPNFRWK